MKQHVCEVCGHVYNPESGDSERSIPPGTEFDKLPADWTCPVCQASLRHFEER